MSEQLYGPRLDSTASNKLAFPPIETALEEPNGLLAIGGNLEPDTLLEAYHHGIFPWADANEPLLWWSPDPRAVIAPKDVHISKSLRKSMARCNFNLSVNRDFSQVINACASARKSGSETWISEDMIRAYEQLHQKGYAHSIEVWQEKQLVGGLYGVAVGKIFCGESMFHRENDASKIAFVALCRLLEKANWPLIDCQLPNNHLQSLGVKTMPRAAFKNFLPNTTRSTSQHSAPIVEYIWQQLPWQNSRELLTDLS